MANGSSKSQADALLAPVHIEDRELQDEEPESLPAFGGMIDDSGDEDDGENDAEEEEELERQIKEDLVFAEQQRVGPLLAELRSQQAEGAAGNRESYSVEHLRRLYQFAPKRPYRRPSGVAKQYCSKVHEKPCLECVTCHFCRQRTTEKKTSCSKCAGVNSFFGGPGRGIWCGSCLQGRIGENIHEVLETPDWICPCCRDICNCSGVNCMRLKRGWFPTNQLSREASEQGYKSVAHYLILTHLSEHASVEDIGAGLISARRARRLGSRIHRGRRAGVHKRRIRRHYSPSTGVQDPSTVDLVDLEDLDRDHVSDDNRFDDPSDEGISRGLRQKQRRARLPSEFQGMKTRRDALELASKPRLEREINDILKDLNRNDAVSSWVHNIVEQSSNFGQHAQFLCLLDQDDRDEDDEDDDHDDPDNHDNGAGSLGRPIDGMNSPGKNAQVGRTSLAVPPTAPAATATSGLVDDPRRIPETFHTTPVVSSVPRSCKKRSSMRVCHDMLPPRRPKASRRRDVRRDVRGQSGQGGLHGFGTGGIENRMRVTNESDTVSLGQDGFAVDTEDTDHDDSRPELSDNGQSEGEAFWVERGENSRCMYASSDFNQDGGPLNGELNSSRAPSAKLSPPHSHQEGMPLDEFVWNGLCLRATSVVDAVKTFYRFHPDVADSMCLQGPDADRKLYDDVYESTRSGLQRVLKSAEGLLTQESVVYYQSASGRSSGSIQAGHAAYGINNNNRQISTVGGLRRAVQLFSFLSRILPEADVTWRIEKRLLGMEPFADFLASSPHAKAVLLRGWLEFVVILEKRGMLSVDTLTSIGNGLASIASEMKAALPLLEAIIENSPLPTCDVSISGWSYDQAARGQKLIDVFTDLSVLYASLHKVFSVGIHRATETSLYLGPKSHHVLTESLVKVLLDPQGGFPASITHQGFTLICTIIDIALKSFDEEGMGMTVQERNALVGDRNQLLDLMDATVIPKLEALVQYDYNMWGSPTARRDFPSNAIIGKVGIGSEKVEVLARCYALRIRAGRATWADIESKATAPYSFAQYWKFANLRYRHFSLYLLGHALERAPGVLHSLNSQGGPAAPHVTTILRMWLLSVLDFGRHECAWYLTRTISKHTSFIQSPVDFRGDKSGKKTANLLANFARSISGKQDLIRGVVLSLDDCLQERQREIVQTAFHADRAVLKWHRATSRSLLAFLGELQRDLRREKELLKVLRRCVVWSIQDLCTIKAAVENRDAPDGSVDNLGSLGLGSLEPSITENIEGDLRQILDSFDFNSMVPMLPRALDDEVEYHEPLWILISGIIGLGDASLRDSVFERVLYDKMAASLFAKAHQSTTDGMIGLPLHRHVLGTHIRRILTKTNFVNSQNEKLGVSAVRFVRAVLSRPEMRTLSVFEGVFDMMLTTWISLLSQTSPTGDSLAVRFELIEMLKDSMRLHGYIIVSSHLHREFWKVVSCECLRMVLVRFPEAVWPSIAMEADFIFYHVLLTYPELELFAPSSPSMLSAAYNNVLSEVGRPPSLDVLDNIAGSNNLADILPRIYGARQREGSLRPGDFAWNLSKASISLLDAMLDVDDCPSHGSLAGQAGTGPAVESGSALTQISRPGIWYPLCCLSYLESVARKGERAYLLIKRECEAFFDRLESKSPGALASLPPKQDQPEVLHPHKNPTGGPIYRTALSHGQSRVERESCHTDSRRLTTESRNLPLRSVGDVERLSLNSIFTFSGKIASIRALKRDGTKVVACTLFDEEVRDTGAPRELNILVSKPDELVASLLDPLGPSGPSKLPVNALFRDIEFVRRRNPVARSTSGTTVEFGIEPSVAMTGKASGKSVQASNLGIRPTPATVFTEASKELVRMGYNADLVTQCLRTLQKHAQALTCEMIVSRVVGMLNE